MRNSDNSTKPFSIRLWRHIAVRAAYLLAVGAGFTLALAAGITLLEG
ncbi:hypothetical protein [Paramagnetospirillum magneticum]|uniref:Uncharacterized protein n=1 Tax=Paramagnetospirillum magneticum (strain ATCC 700264 / AMB-1) TaxID=342108 RepID=Q2W2S2_PARM1|nr:hypothetical protein [Paramagnetospirillum magneticum]BAE51853.1 hypothetical protein amb3049 [Paramagnetospirillum magneticum AMB-1]